MNALVTVESDVPADPIAHLLETLRANAPERDRLGGHAAEEKGAIRAQGLLLDAVPRAYGGHGRSWSEILGTVRRIAAVDSSLAHVLAFHHLQVATVQIYGNDEQQSRWFAATVRDHGWWGNAMNPLDRRLEAQVAADGFVLDGIKSFCSGTSGSHYMTLSAIPAGGSGPMLLGIVATRQSGIRVLDDWDPIGQRQTDSNSVCFERVVLPARDVIRASDATPSAFHTLRACFGQLILVNLYLGIAIGARQEAHDYAHSGSTRPWATSGVAHATDDPYMLNRFGELHVQIAAATALADRAANALDAAFAHGQALGARERAAVAISIAEAKVIAHRAGLYASQELFEVVGARGTRASLGFDRFWRNARTHTLHDPLDYKLNLLGRWSLKGEAPTPSLYN